MNVYIYKLFKEILCDYSMNGTTRPWAVSGTAAQPYSSKGQETC